MRRAAVVLAVVLLIGGAWIAYAELWRHGGGKPVAWRDLSGSVGAVEIAKPAFQRFRSRGALERFLTRATVPPIDFARDEVLLAATGARSSTGYAVHIDSISDERSRIVVRVRETTPSLGQRVDARVTYPYVLATIPRSDKRVHFIWLGRP